MAGLLILLFGGILLWLRMYTNHGQKLELKDYTGTHIDRASEHAEKNTFQMIVNDSIHRVGQPGGMIIAQNPAGGSLVKEDRKIYVDITKYTADEIALESLSPMYGRNYKSKAEELRNLEIKSEIKGYRHDPGTPGHILQVWYDGSLIDGQNGRKRGVKIKKGGTLSFVLSEIGGGQTEVPNLVCRPYGQLSFLLKNHKLRLGSVVKVGAITDMNSAYIISQSPDYTEGKMIQMGSEVQVEIQQEEPESCK